ncbi:MAG TPA: hypothetical protein VF516_39810 [Kofleriaceae bacterium]
MIVDGALREVAALVDDGDLRRVGVLDFGNRALEVDVLAPEIRPPRPTCSSSRL